ncbi:protein neuralized isoform X2 [Atheta coriaria]|uniref:protein neuralized isoform X2 n=1 Tax=Dalotia coriaria TaxID=877792 RepID=UPI0031F460A5
MGQINSGMPASRSTSEGLGTNNLPPLQFHNVRGDHIRLYRNATVARRVESFCKGIAFSARPVKVNEKICIKFVEISNNWSGVIRFGFTYHDPSTLRYNLPKYACPDLTNKPGYWAKALPERFATQNNVLYYYVTSSGDVHFGINGEEKGIFFGGVETRGQLWALIDVYGNSTAIEFVEFEHQLNNSRRDVVTNNCDNHRNNNANNIPDEIDRLVYPMQNVNIRTTAERDSEELNLPVIRYQPSHLNFNAFPLHRTRGRNVRFNSSRTIASRIDSEFCQGYVFTGRPLNIGEKMVVQILATENVFEGCLGLGLTSCDPATLQISDLPDDSNFLLDRPEYWVISRDIARTLNVGDEISFYVSPTGEVQISKNGGLPVVVIHVDQSLRLWAFFDVFGSTRKIRVLSCPLATTPNRSHERRIVTPNSESMNSLNTQSEMRRNVMLPSNSRCAPQVDISEAPGTNYMPTTHVNIVNHANNNPTPHPSHHSSQNLANFNSDAMPSMTSLPTSHYHSNHNLVPTTSNATMISMNSNTYIEPISAECNKGPEPLYGLPMGSNQLYSAGAECTICYEKPIDAVLYMCGHMCMCYECALQQWRGKGGGQCPLCRAVIRDVIRTYKS